MANWTQGARVRRIRARDAALVVGVVAVGGAAVGLLLHHRSHPSATFTANPSPTAVSTTAAGKGPLAAWLGDNWISGTGVGGVDDGIAAVASRTQGWSYVLDIESAGGWTQNGLGTQERGATPLATRVVAAAARGPRVVVLQGGINDAAHGATPAAVEAALRSTVTTLRAHLTATVPVVVVGPAWPDSAVPTAVLGIERALATGTKALGVPFVDPIAEHWVTGVRASGSTPATGTAATYTGSDGASPSEAGTRAYAADLAKALQTLGVRVTAG